MIFVGIKYCGGCRSGFDRAAAVGRVTAAPLAAGAEARFEGVSDGGSYDALLVACGCGARCADLSGYEVRGPVVYLDREDGWKDAAAALERGFAGMDCRACHAGLRPGIAMTVGMADDR